jgi:hypothetical protein
METTTVKDLMENEDLASYITEDLGEFADNAIVTYEVWAIGYDGEHRIMDADLFIDFFENPDDAVAKAKSLTLADIVYKAAEEDTGNEIDTNVAFISIEVETVIDDEEGTMNVGTIYKKEISLSDNSTDDNDYSIVVPITSNDYTLLEDGSLEISCEILKDFNKNDMVQVWFVDEADKVIVTYKIISKTTANKFICEFVY